MDVAGRSGTVEFVAGRGGRTGRDWEQGVECGKFVQGLGRESLSGPECCVEIRRAVVLV